MRDDGVLFLDMLLAAREAVAFANGLTFAEFQRDRMAQLAILKTVETVGEAASRVSAQTRNAHSENPWSRIIGMRNRLVHGYFDINLMRVWNTTKQDIPHLIPQLERLVPPEQG